MVVVFLTDPATTGIYTLSLHDALPIWAWPRSWRNDRRTGPAVEVVLHPDREPAGVVEGRPQRPVQFGDRKSTRLNSSHSSISYAVFCLKKKNASLQPGGRTRRGVARSP